MSGWRPLLTAFTLWFVHFMVCWTAAEIWPRQWPANRVAWAATTIALVAMVVHAVRVHAQSARGELAGWNRRFAQGAIAIATAAIVFSAVPSMLLLPDGPASVRRVVNGCVGSMFTIERAAA